MKKAHGRHHHHESEIKNLQIIENEVEQKMKNPQEITYCPCNICHSKYDPSEKNKEFIKQTSSTMRISSYTLQQFFKMVSAMNAKVFLKIDIPEICFFSKGQPKLYYRSNNLGVHKVQITLHNKKNLINMFMENHRLNQSLKNNTKTSESKFNLGIMAPHIKNLDSVVPRYKCGEEKDAVRPQHFIFHNNSNFDDAPGGQNNPGSSQEICLAKYKEKGFQLLNEKALRDALKSLLILQNVQYIQSYIKPHEDDSELIESKFDITRGPDNDLMFSRSLTQIKIDINLINKLSKDFIPVEHIENYELMLKDVPHEYCLYQTYKMIHYIELIRDLKVSKLSTVWVRDCTGELCFIGLTQFQWEENKKISVDIGEIQELKELINSELTDFEQELLRAWEHMKTRKQKPQQKAGVDKKKEEEIAKIKLESSVRIASEKSKILKKSSENQKLFSQFSRH